MRGLDGAESAAENARDLGFREVDVVTECQYGPLAEWQAAYGCPRVVDLRVDDEARRLDRVPSFELRSTHLLLGEVAHHRPQVARRVVDRVPPRVQLQE